MPQRKPILVITPGDTAGVGPEVALAALASADARSSARLLVMGDDDLFRLRAARVGAAFRAEVFESAEDFSKSDAEVGFLLAGGQADENVIGRVDARCGSHSVECVRAAARLALGGLVDGIVTAPINKQSIHAAGFAFEGHTELLGELDEREPVMMLMGGGLRVAIVTRHVALRRVPEMLTAEEIVRTAEVVAAALRRDLGLQRSRIGVLALNPHASDGGRFGDEEERVIAPAVAELISLGVDAAGPLVPDVAYWHALRGEYDAIVAMYHDQGLIPLKTLAFDVGVNLTLGLRIVRASPDHGTAFEIAGKGSVNAASMIEAVKTAALVATNRMRGAR